MLPLLSLTSLIKYVCFRFLLVRNVAVTLMVKSCALCLPVLRQNVWTQSMNQISAVPSAKMVKIAFHYMIITDPGIPKNIFIYYKIFKLKVLQFVIK